MVSAFFVCVDSESRKQKAAVQDDNARAWVWIARHEPYFAVLTHDRFLSRNMTASTQAEFYATGEAWVAHVLAVIRRLAPALEPHSVLEFGCGPGRLAIPFANKISRVVAADASPEMLRLVAEAAARFESGNVEMASAEAVLAGGEQFDLVSVHGLLQHVEPDDGLALLRRLLTLVTDGGFAVLHVPFQMKAGPVSTATRRLRAAVPPLNWIANALRHRPAAIPMFAPHAHDLADVASVLEAAGFEAPYVEFVREGELDFARMFVRKRLRADEDVENAASAGAPADQPRLIDVNQLIAKTSVEELNITADAYFSSLTDWEHHLAKPFASVEDASHILTHVGPLIGGLRVAPGDTVLEFGAGTGWLSHALTQLGCKAILLDVSRAALQIARELYTRQPVIGRKPEPEFLVFDGHRIDLPDASVDRVICFDAFHHAPNPGEVIAELARVLRPGGIAGFSEPGPQHSKTPQSQFEMRTYRVVENDVHIRAIWNAARAAGFDRIELAAVAGPPLLLSLADFEDLVGRGDVAARWMEIARDHLSNVRMFFLHRAGEERADSRRRAGLAVSLEARALRPPRAGEPAAIEATLTNGGTSRWLPGSAVPGGVGLGIHVYSATGEMIDFEFHREPIPREVAPGESIGLRLETRPVPPGAATLELDCVAEGVTWFAQIGATPVTIEIAQ